MLNQDNILTAFKSKGIDWSEVNSNSEQILILGKKSFEEAREIQNALVKKRIQNEIENTIIFTEHPPTLSLGNRISLIDDSKYFDTWKELGVEVVKTNRGGELTFHGPGQLIIYPIIKINSVKSFIKNYLELLSKSLAKLDIESKCKLEPAGLWLEQGSINKKIGSVGLKIENKVTNHGFSLNLNCALEPFLEFNVCGDKNTSVTSVQELSNNNFKGKHLKTLVNNLCNNSLKFIRL